MIVKFDCGCVGLPANATLPIPILIIACDGEGYGFTPRLSLADKGWEPLSPEAAAEVVAEIDRLVTDGYGLRNLNAALTLLRERK